MFVIIVVEGWLWLGSGGVYWFSMCLCRSQSDLAVTTFLHPRSTCIYSLVMYSVYILASKHVCLKHFLARHLMIPPVMLVDGSL